MTYIGSLTNHYGLGALAYDAANDILYASDWDPTSVGSDLLTFDRTTGVVTIEHTLIISPPFNHLRFVHGLAYNTADNLLYAPYVYWQSETQYVQLRLIDLATGLTTDYGPPIADVSAHSLIVNSVPSGPILIPVPTTAWLGIALLGCMSVVGVVRKKR